MPAENTPLVPARRRFILQLLGLCAALLVLRWGYWYMAEGRYLVSTDDAYVGANSVIIAPKITGYITQVKARNNQPVHAGDVLAYIDAEDYRLAVEAARDKVDTQDATIARIARQIDAQGANVEQAQAQVAAAQATAESALADAQRAALEYDRAFKLEQTNFGSQQRLEQATADKKRTHAAVVGAQAALASAQAQLAYAKTNVEVLISQKREAEKTRAELVNAVARAERDLSFTQIRAPFDGVIGNKAIEVGQYVQPGTRLMTLVSQDQVYVDANFKETQIANIKPGQSVDIEVDAFQGEVLKGTVRSIAPASGSEFSLLPPDNATGNFTKIVQRMAVRIHFDPAALKSHVLRPGLSVIATIHTS